MIKINGLPQVLDQNKKPINGVYEKIFDFCDKNHNAKCVAHYSKISSQKGYHICPYGFTSHVTNVNGRDVIYSSLEVEGFSNRKLVKRNTSRKDEKRKFTKVDVETILNWESNIDANFNAKNNILRNYDQNVKVVSQKKEVLDDTLHELRKLNNILKKQAFLLKSELDNLTYKHIDILIRSKNIHSTTQLVSARLNAYDFTLNPEIVETNPPARLSLYRKFEKARHCLEVITEELGIKINFKGESRAMSEYYEIIEILPFILFENSIKFSYKKNPIECEFIESNGVLNEIIIKNKTQLPQEVDLDQLKKKHIRSQNIEDIAGSGKGLYIASLICDYHNIDLQIETEYETRIDNKEIGNFIIKLNLSNISTQ